MSETSSSVPFSQVVDGFQIPGVFSAEAFREAVSYKPRSDDLFLVTYPKCGTTWTGNIILLILLKGKPLKSSAEMHTRSPFLEMIGVKAVEEMIRPGPIKTHLPFRLIPWSNNAKYVYVTRNPKDCCVSYFHHLRNLPGHKFSGTFDQFFELFLSGKTDYGDYFDHLLEWYSHRNDPNVLFITYEELKEDIDSAILKIASFIDDEKYAKPIRDDPEVLSSIKKYSSLKEMKEFMSKGFEEMFTMSEEDMKKSPMPDSLKEFITKTKKEAKQEKVPSGMNQFVRKGIIGDWKNYFNSDQSRRLHEKFIERTKGTDIPNWWRKYM